MKTIPVTDAQNTLEEMLAQLQAGGEPWIVTEGDRPEAVLLAFADYQTLVAQAADAIRIVRKSGVVGGAPVIEGTRISVPLIAQYVLAGESIDGILEAFPHLTRAHVYAALAYYYAHQGEVDQLIASFEPERIASQLGFTLSEITEGIQEAHDVSGRW
jgi:uncharacterized protein (DUF433 family)